MSTATNYTQEEILTAFIDLLEAGKLDEDTLFSVKRLIEDAIGCYPCISACVDDVLEAAAERWVITDQIKPLAKYAAYQAARHCELDLDIILDAALDIIEDDAAKENITLEEVPA